MSAEVGDKAPDFTLPSTQGQLTLGELVSQGKVILAFYRQDNTPTCASEISVLKEDYEIIQQLGAQVVGISVDDLESHRSFAESLGGLPFPLACDEKLAAAQAYDVVNEESGRSRRAIFVIDKGGTIIHTEPWFQPGDPTQYEDIFQSIGFE